VSRTIRVAWLACAVTLVVLAGQCSLAGAVPLDDGGSADHYDLSQPPGTEKGDYGSDIACDGTTLVVGDPGDAFRGAVQVFDWNGSDWVLGQEIRIPRDVVELMGDRTEQFGFSVAVDGDVMAVGEPGRGAARGTAYIYERVAGEWQFAARVTNIDSNRGDQCGYAVAVDDGVVVVSAPSAYEWNGSSWGPGRGAISLYEKVGGVWTNIQTLYGTAKDYGHDVDLSDGRLLVLNLDAGIVDIHVRVGGVFVPEDEVTVSTGVGGHADLDGERFAVAEWDQGRARVFERRPDGSWVAAGAPQAGFSDGRTIGVAIEGDVLCLESYRQDGSVRGTDVFTHDGDGWVHQRTLSRAPDDTGWDNADDRLLLCDGDLYRTGVWDDDYGWDSGVVTAYPSVGCESTVLMGSSLSVAAPGVLLNDSVDSTGAVTAELIDDVDHGTLDLSPDGSFDYTPDSGFWGDDTFVYSQLENGESVGTATVHLTVRPRAYVAGKVVNESGTPLSGIRVRLAPVGTADPDGDPGTLVALTGASGDYEFVDIPPGDYWITYLDGTDLYRDEHVFGVGVPIEHSYYLEIGADTYLSGMRTTLSVLEDVPAQRSTRIAGSTRYATSAACADMRPSAGIAVLAAGGSYPDALSASALAGLYNAPVLLTKQTSVPSDVIDEMQDLGVGYVFIVGGPAVVSDEVITQLELAGFTSSRIYGADRYATSAEVAKHVMSWRSRIDPFVVRGDNFADALSVAPFAWMQVRPVILVKPGYAPAAACEAFDACDTNTVIIAGGTNAVSVDVLGDLADATGLASIYYYRLYGATRYDTSAAVADAWEVPFDYIGLASGTNYPDALAGAASMGWYQGPVLLTPSSSLHSSAKQVIQDNGKYLWTVFGFGGPAALSDSVLASARSAAGQTVYDMDASGSVLGVVGTMPEADALTDTNDPVSVERESFTVR